MTFGPLLEVPSKGRATASTPALFGLVADLLEYPEEDMVSRGPEFMRRARALPDDQPARLVVDFCRWFQAADPNAMREAYVATFDHSRRNALYMTYATHGDTRARGAALLSFKRLYDEQGFAGPSDELPDYLPTVLRFAATAPTAGAALAMARAGVELVASSLAQSGSPWAGLLEAVCLTSAMVDGPPTEAVGIVQEGALV